MSRSSVLFSAVERRSVAALASLYALRMLGLFMVLPVMMIEGEHLQGATPQLLGLAMGVYGLTQAFLQIPAGTLSDRIGRKPVIIGGLIIFALGSVIAATADSVYGVIFGRALQGAGAIASAIMALVTDLTREHNRMKAMASIGASIGLSFSVALVLGPWLVGLGGLSLIFSVTAVLALLGVAVTIWIIPNPAPQRHRDAMPVMTDIRQQLANGRLWPLNIGIFLLHAVLVAIFVAVPAQLQAFDIHASQHSWVYLPVLLVSFVLMVPLIIIAEKRRQMKRVVLMGMVMIASALLLLAPAQHFWQWMVLLVVFFWGFNLLEASLPSWLSKVAPAGAKGSAMGIYSTMQFLGAFAGGTLGGWIISHYDSTTLFIVLASCMALWGILMLRSQAPQYLISVRLTTSGALTDEQLQQLHTLNGVAEINWLADEQAVYLKVNAEQFQAEHAAAILTTTGDNYGSQC